MKTSRASVPSGESGGQDLREVPTEKAPRVYYTDESVTLYHGDCLDVLPQLRPVDHVITDPPYGRDVYLRAARTTASDKGLSDYELKRRGQALKKMGAGEIGAIDEILEPVGREIARLVRRWAIVFSDAEMTHRWRASLTAEWSDLFGKEAVHGMRYVRTGVWVKPDAMPQMTGDRPGTGFEPCTITHAPGSMCWNGGGSLAVWTHSTAKGDGRPDGHPCPKPLPLMTELVTLFTDEGETILDPFAGSGTTGVAAKLNGRKAILIEREEKYCEVAAKRLRETEPGRLFDRVPRAKPQRMTFEEPVSVDAVDPQGGNTSSGPRA